jgi:hypothetical protein
MRRYDQHKPNGSKSYPEGDIKRLEKKKRKEKEMF